MESTFDSGCFLITKQHETGGTEYQQTDWTLTLNWVWWPFHKLTIISTLFSHFINLFCQQLFTAVECVYM